MAFVDMLKSKINDKPQQTSKQIEESSPVKIEEAQKPEEVLRGAGYKIRLVTPTSFGTQIDFAKSYNPDDVTKVLSSFQVKIKGKSVFIVD
jgi:hypothetical protein